MKKLLLLFYTLILVASSCNGKEDPVAPLKSSPSPTENNGEDKKAVNMWAIDMTPLELNGKYYAIWSGWNKYYHESEGDGQYLYIAEMTFHDTKPKVKLGKRVLLASAELPWELKEKEGFSLVEGPTVIKNGEDVFITYSTRGSWTINYKMGQLKLKSKDSDPLDPKSWIKKKEPVFSGVKTTDNLGYHVFGVGHASFTTSPDGTEHWINYHSKTSLQGGWDDRRVYFQKFTFDKNGDPDFGIPANSALPMIRPSGEVEIEKKDGIENPSKTFMNPVREGADPWIVKHGDKYYTCRSIQKGLWITESRFMTKFEGDKTYEEARVKVWGPPGEGSGVWNEIQCWAPELHFINNKWYIFYAAGKQKAAPYWEHRAGVLISTTDSPYGPYEEHDIEPLFTGEIQ